MDLELKDKFKKCITRLRNKNSKDDFQFISEKPLDKGLLFGHEGIVTTLKKVILKSPESFTIGLYGDWGSGKSSIAETLQRELQEDSIPLIIFDVWKHEGDALRRTFIRQTHHFFKNDKLWKNKYKGKDELLDDLSRSKTSVERNPLTVFQLLRGAIMFPISISILGLITWLITDKLLDLDYFQKDDIPGAITTFLGLFSVSFLFKYAEKFIENIKGDKVEYIQDKIQDPIEFENKFKQLIKSLNSEIKKVVFVFDNLDRVSGEKAIQIMSTIKTFLDPIDKSIKNKNIVFVIPCDETAIKRHLKKTLNYSEDFRGDDYHRYAGEYLRKFFNTILWIPEFYFSELEDLAQRKLAETKIDDFNNDELSALIVLVFNKNPRQIIQFINILISNYLLIKQRPIEGLSLSADIAKLAKYLLLIQKFPDIIAVYRSTLNYDLETFPAELSEDVYGVRKFSEKRITEFKNFLVRTEHVKIESLDVFFKLRRSIYESKLENSVKLIDLIANGEISHMMESLKEIKDSKEDAIDKNVKSTMEFVDSLNLKDKKHELGQIINERLRKIKNPILLAKFIEGLLYLLERKELELEQDVYRMMYNELKQNGNNIGAINPHLLLRNCYDKLLIKAEKESLRKMISKKHIEYFVSINENT